MKPRIYKANGQRGIALLEALFGILIFSIGILAVIGMQATAVKTVAESKYRMDASFLANEIIGGMWADRANLAAYAYAGGLPQTEILNWVTKVNSTLPGAAANPPQISVAAGNVVTVTIFWQHPEEANLSPAPPPHSHRAIASINCC